MARVPEEVINDIRQSVDIVEVVSQYVPLTRKGRNYVGVCPFHEDHNPSMSVSSDKQIYHCFVCGAGGNVFRFVQEFQQISFMNALKEVADFANIPFAYEITTTPMVVSQEFQRLYSLLKDTIEFCCYELKSLEGKKYLTYLLDRGFTQATIDHFLLGFHPPKNKLYPFLHAKEHNDEDMITSNVARLSQQGIQDVFSQRIMIPIHDHNGNPVGFSARDIDGFSSSKYINTAQTPIYTKGDILFNYHRAKEYARKQKQIIIVEGALDVMALHQVGIHHVIATLGTACTQHQIALLKRLNVSALIFYDGDKAGQEATYKLGALLEESKIAFEIVQNASGEDPDEMIQKHGKEELFATIKKTMSWIEFLFSYLPRKYNLENYTEKKEFAQLLQHEIQMQSDLVEQQSYFNILKDMTGFDYSISMEQEQPSYQTIIQNYGYATTHSYSLKAGLENAQWQIIAMMLLSKKANEYYREHLGFLPNEEFHNLSLIIVNYYRNHDIINVADLLNEIQDENERKILIELSDWELAPLKFQEEMMEEAISKIKHGLISKKISHLLEQSNQLSDPIQKAKIAEEVLKLRRNRGD